MITYQENTGTDSQSDPDSSSMPIVYTYLTEGKTLGRLSIRNQQRGANRLYPARNGAVPTASARVYADGSKLEKRSRRHRWARSWPTPSLHMAIH
jgi:hypothetical protein